MKLVWEADGLNESMSGLQVLKERPSARPAEGCVIYGLFMEGARWAAREACVAESLPKELHTGRVG